MWTCSVGNLNLLLAAERRFINKTCRRRMSSECVRSGIYIWKYLMNIKLASYELGRTLNFQKVSSTTYSYIELRFVVSITYFSLPNNWLSFKTLKVYVEQKTIREPKSRQNSQKVMSLCSKLLWKFTMEIRLNRFLVGKQTQKLSKFETAWEDNRIIKTNISTLDFHHKLQLYSVNKIDECLNTKTRTKALQEPFRYFQRISLREC